METTDEKLSHLVRVVDKMEMQMQRMVADQESEKGTRRRRNDDVDKRFEHFEGVISGQGGLYVRLDRLEQWQNAQKSRQTQLYALWISVGLLVIREVISWIH